MPAERTCVRCRANLSGDAPFGLCPKCLIEQGLDGNSTEKSGTAQTIRISQSAIVNPPAPPTPAELAKHFPQLEILELLGQGAMGIVYNLERYDTALHRLDPHGRNRHRRVPVTIDFGNYRSSLIPIGAELGARA